MWTRVLIVVLIAVLLFAPGCVTKGWMIWPDGEISTGGFGGLDGKYPRPGSPAYRAALVWGFIGDALWIPIAGIGFLWFAIDLFYLYLFRGGYAARWHEAFGADAADEDEFWEDDSRPDGG